MTKIGYSNMLRLWDDLHGMVSVISIIYISVSSANSSESVILKNTFAWRLAAIIEEYDSIAAKLAHRIIIHNLAQLLKFILSSVLLYSLAKAPGLSRNSLR